MFKLATSQSFLLAAFWLCTGGACTGCIFERGLYAFYHPGADMLSAGGSAFSG
jgi:hypothetical protein